MQLHDAKQLCEVLNSLDMHDEREVYDLVALLSAKWHHLWWRYTREGYFEVKEK